MVEEIRTKLFYSILELYYGGVHMTEDTKRVYLATECNEPDEDFAASDEEVLNISKKLLEQNREAYEVLAK